MRRQEVVRKLLHAPGGLLPPVALWAFGWTGALVVALTLLTYLVVALDLSRRGVRLPVLAAIVDATSREEAPSLIAAIEFLVSVVVLGLLFPLPYLFASLALLGVGDTAAALVGMRWGRRKLPWNPRKSWLGLGAGILLGVPAFVGFALIGARMQAAGFATTAPLDQSGSAAPALAFLLVAFAAVHLVGWIAVRSGARRVANASAATPLGVFGVALAPALAFALVAPLFIGGPLLPLHGGHGARTRILLLAVPVLAMIVESRVRGRDNLWVPGVAATLAYGLVGLSESAA